MFKVAEVSCEILALVFDDMAILLKSIQYVSELSNYYYPAIPKEATGS